MAEMELTGKVILQKFAGGSKSDHDAIFLDTGKEKLRLKRKGGNPFYDSSLHELVGKTIKARGKITPYFFEITNTPEEIP